MKEDYKDVCCEESCEEKLVETNEPEVARELATNEDKIVQLVELVAKLENRLSCIMSPSKPQECCDEATEAITDIAKEIRDKSDRIENVNNSVRDILERLEV